MSFISFGNALARQIGLDDYSARIALIRHKSRVRKKNSVTIRVDAPETPAARGPRQIVPRTDLLSEFDQPADCD